jgi:hypothetical protein
VAGGVLLLASLDSCCSLLVAHRSEHEGEPAVAIAEERHSRASEVAVDFEAAGVHGVGGEAAVRNDRATAGVSARLARSVSVAEEEALDLAAEDPERRMHSQSPVLNAAILLVVEGPAAEPAGSAYYVAVVASTVPVALSRRRPVGLPGSRTM